MVAEYALKQFFINPYENLRVTKIYKFISNYFIMKIKISLATKKDRKQLYGFFSHYKINKIIKNRIDCYTSHNFTVIAKDGDKIVGSLQWYVKEDPKAGVVEFEEFFVSKDYRGKGIGAKLISYGVNSVKSYFKKIGIIPRRVFLFTSKSNLISRKVIEKNGFESISEIGDIFYNNESELFYCLKL